MSIIFQILSSIFSKRDASFYKLYLWAVHFSYKRLTNLNEQILQIMKTFHVDFNRFRKNGNLKSHIFSQKLPEISTIFKRLHQASEFSRHSVIFIYNVCSAVSRFNIWLQHLKTRDSICQRYWFFVYIFALDSNIIFCSEPWRSNIQIQRFRRIYESDILVMKFSLLLLSWRD